MKITTNVAAMVAVALFCAGCPSGSDENEVAVGQVEGDRQQNAAADPGDRNTVTSGGCIDSEVQQERMLELVNAIRSTEQRCGDVTFPAVPALSWSERIEAAALGHAEFMASERALEHTGENGSNFGDRLTAEGYRWRTAAENIAFGFSTPEAVTEAWLNSEGHCENLMNDRVQEFAVSCADTGGENQVRYWAEVFARPAR